MNHLTIKLVFLSLLFSLVTPVFSEGITLEQAIRETRINSDSARMMKETMIKSDQMIREKWSAVYPSISSTLFGGRSYGSVMGGASSGMKRDESAITRAASNEDPSQMIGSMLAEFMKPRESALYSASVQISQPIYTFGKLGTAITVAAQVDSSVHYSYARNLQQLQLLALDAFYRVLLLDMTVCVAERSLARKKELSEFLERNFKLGSGSKAQILAMQADLKSGWAEMITTRQNVRTAGMILGSLMGRSISDSIQIDTASAGAYLLSTQLPGTTEAVTSALARRGDLRCFEFLAAASRGGAKIYKAMYLPTIAAQASFGTNGTEAGNLFEWDKRTWTLGIGLQWTLFDGFANNAKAKQFQSDARKLQTFHEALSKMIAIEVLTALAECAAADSTLIAAEEMLAAARESYELTSENFRQGSGQFAELQLTEERLRQAETGAMGARYRLIRSRAALQVAMGNDIIN